ncbi:MAG: LLM class flavin-dependent oxidoreductase [Acidimicrobiales bacterium]
MGIVQMPVDPWGVTVDRAKELEQMGFDHLWLYDHLSWQRYRDHDWHATMPWLTGIAANTERIRLGTMVASPNLRHPLTMAKDAMSLDHISNGRFILGLGAGSSGFDATVFGHEPLDGPARADRLTEYLAVTDGLLRGALTNHQGRWYTVDEGRVIPGCVQEPRVPIAVAAGGPRTIRLAGAVADTWITLGDPASAAADVAEFEAVLRRQMAIFVEGCERSGRDPADPGKLCFLPSTFADPMADIETFTDFAGRIVDLGFTDLVVHDRRADDPALDFDPALIPAIAAWTTTTAAASTTAADTTAAAAVTGAGPTD